MRTIESKLSASRAIRKALTYCNPSYVPASRADARRVANVLLANVPSADPFAGVVVEYHLMTHKDGTACPDCLAMLAE